MKSIIFYSNSTIVGGHELMTIKIAEILSSQYDVSFIVSIKNSPLIAILKNKNIKFRTCKYYANKLQIIRNFFSYNHKKWLKQVLTSEKCSAVVLVQGNIDISLPIVYPAKKLNIPVISYIPLAQPLYNISKNKFLGFIKDVIRKKEFNLPNYFLTISESQKNYILNYNPRAEVKVLENVIEVSKLKRIPQERAKMLLEIPNNKLVVGYIGRLEKWHKGLDILCEFLQKNLKNYLDIEFIFIGNGSYLNKINSLKCSNSNIRILSWRDDLSEVYSSLDAILLPSRYEGVSLTMLEAFYYNISPIANNIPEFRDYVSPGNLYNAAEFKSLDRLLINLRQGKLRKSELRNENLNYDMFRSIVYNIFRNWVR